MQQAAAETQPAQEYPAEQAARPQERPAAEAAPRPAAAAQADAVKHPAGTPAAQAQPEKKVPAAKQEPQKQRREKTAAEQPQTEKNDRSAGKPAGSASADRNAGRPAASAAAAQNVRKTGRVTVLTRTKGATVRINASDAITFKHMILTQPDRFVIDLTGSWDVSTDAIPGNPLVTNIRLGKFKNRTRVVIDMSSQPRSAKVNLSKNNRRLDVRVDQ